MLCSRVCACSPKKAVERQQQTEPQTPQSPAKTAASPAKSKPLVRSASVTDTPLGTLPVPSRAVVQAQKTSAPPPMTPIQQQQTMKQTPQSSESGKKRIPWSETETSNLYTVRS